MYAHQEGIRKRVLISRYADKDGVHGPPTGGESMYTHWENIGKNLIDETRLRLYWYWSRRSYCE
jgi:hypothetical protein